MVLEVPSAGGLLAAVVTLVLAPYQARAVEPQPYEIRHVRVPSHDGVELAGYLVLPTDVPAGQKLPVVLWSVLYFGQGMLAGDNPRLYDNSYAGEAVPVNLLLEHGYVIAISNVRGTGNSARCLSWFGKSEREDQAFLVEWLAARGWGNSKVGMIGHVRISSSS